MASYIINENDIWALCLIVKHHEGMFIRFVYNSQW